MANPLAIAGYGMGALGTISEYNSELRASRLNERSAMESAELSLKAGRERERRQRVMGAQALGDIRSSYAASGVTMEGSALDVLEYSAANAELDALTVRWEAETQATSYRNQASLERAKRSSLKKQRTFDLLSAGFNAGAKETK